MAAEQRSPIITPQITSTAICRIRRETSSTSPIDAIAPKKADPTIIHEVIIPPLPKTPTSSKDTASLAPEEIPNTKGLAIGLSKKV